MYDLAHRANGIVERMILERAMHPDYLSNTYLVADHEGAEAFFIDAGGPVQPLFEAVERYSLTPTHILLTHHHADHVFEIDAIQQRYGGNLEVLISPKEKHLVNGITGTVDAGQTIRVAGLDVSFHAIPGHTSGMLAIETCGNVFTGDTLFKNSVGGVRAPDSTSYADLKHSIMEVLMKMPPETILRPGHIEETTVATEWDNNSFIRIWRGLDPEGASPCKALGEDATLVHLGNDYDGGHKAWIRWPDGSDDIVPGSKVETGD